MMGVMMWLRNMFSSASPETYTLSETYADPALVRLARNYRYWYR